LVKTWSRDAPERSAHELARERDFVPVVPERRGALERGIGGRGAGRIVERLPNGDAIIDPAADRMAQAAGLGPATGSQAPKQRVERRKAQRAARKRNRRR